MPERNLVWAGYTNRRLMLWIAVMITMTGQIGCSKLGQSTFSRDLLNDRTGRSSWTSEEDSASRYMADPYADLNAAKQKDEARIIGVDDANTSDIDVKLLAQPAPSINQESPDSSAEGQNTTCEHPTECDCHKPKRKPKLPYAEPIDPPPVQSTVPPSGLISQPLTPIFFDGQSREIRADDTAENRNSLRRNEKWSHEKVATLINKPENVDAASAESRPADINLPEDAMSQPLPASDLNRVVSQMESTMAITEVTGPSLSSPSTCEFCQQSDCNGKCNDHEDKATISADHVINSDPIVIVATTSEDTVPPFAECPPDEDPLESATGPRSTTLDSSPLLVETKSDVESGTEAVVDLPLEVSGSFDTDAPCCPACGSSQCANPDCGQSTGSEIANVEPIQTSTVDLSSFQPVAGSESFTPPIDPTAVESVSETQFDANIVDASPIESTSTVESGNDFQPVSHTNDVPPKPIDSELPTWEQPLSPEPSQVPESTDSHSAETTKETLQFDPAPMATVDRGMDNGLLPETVSPDQQESKPLEQQPDEIHLVQETVDSEISDAHDPQPTAATLAELRKAVERLESLADLTVANGTFCKQVSGFGQFKAFSSTTFEPTQRMLVYCEVENYSSVLRQANQRTEVCTLLRGSYAIYDRQGRAVQQAEYPIVEDVARKRRRDFYMYFPIQLDNLPPGQYRLELQIEDLNGNKTGSIEPGMEFRVD